MYFYSLQYMSFSFFDSPSIVVFKARSQWHSLLHTQSGPSKIARYQRNNVRRSRKGQYSESRWPNLSNDLNSPETPKFTDGGWSLWTEPINSYEPLKLELPNYHDSPDLPLMLLPFASVCHRWTTLIRKDHRPLRHMSLLGIFKRADFIIVFSKSSFTTFLQGFVGRMRTYRFLQGLS